MGLENMQKKISKGKGRFWLLCSLETLMSVAARLVWVLIAAQLSLGFVRLRFKMMKSWRKE